MDAAILFSRKPHLGVITLNRPQSLNALDLPMIQALQQQLNDWEADESIHAVILQATPGKAFCAGGDIRWLYTAGQAKDPAQAQFFWQEYRLNHTIQTLSKPYISLLDGITMGGGVGISLHGSHPIATEHFIFSMPETNIGFFPDVGASYFLARCPRQLGIYLGLTGDRLNAREAYQLGLVKQVVNAEQLPKLLNDLEKMDLSMEAHRRIDAYLQQFTLKFEPTRIQQEQKTIDHYFGQASVEEIITSLQEGEEEWSKHCLMNLQQKAPLSLKITFAQIHKAKTLSQAECLRMDYCLANHFIRDSDFYEGVRALLIDKDKSPHWQPDKLSDTPQSRVEGYFTSEHGELELT